MSQPIFCLILSIGCLVKVMSIIPLSQQGEYRVTRDENTYLLTQEPNPEVPILDMTCMAGPWFYFIGEAMIFSALFAKILRVKKLYEQSISFRRVTVKAHNMKHIIILTLGFMILLMLLWQFIAPLRWDRKALLMTSKGYALTSMEGCMP